MMIDLYINAHNSEVIERVVYLIIFARTTNRKTIHLTVLKFVDDENQSLTFTWEGQGMNLRLVSRFTNERAFYGTGVRIYVSLLS